MSTWPPPIGVWHHIPTQEEMDAASEPITAKTLAELRAMSEEDLIRRHDWLANSGDPNGSWHQRSSVGFKYYLDEIARRDAAKTNEQMLEYTKRVTDMTRHIKWLTIANVAAAVAAAVAAWVVIAH